MEGSISRKPAARPRRRWWLPAGGVLLIAALVAVAYTHNQARISGTTPEERAASIGKIVDDGKPGAKEVAAGAANDPDPKVREAAVVALGRLRHRPDLVRIGLRDPEPSVRYAAAAVMGSLGDPSAADALAGILQNDGDTWARVGAVIGLSRIGTPEATYHIVRAMDVPDPKVQLTAMNVITARANIRWETPADPADRQEWSRKVRLVKKFDFVRQAIEEHGPK